MAEVNEEAPRAPSLFESIQKIVVVYFVISLVTSFLKGNNILGNNNNQDGAQQSARGGPDFYAPASRISIQEAKDLNEASRAQKPVNVLGFLLPEVYKVPVFPTHDENDLQLGQHKCIVAPKERLNLHVYVTELDSFVYSRDKHLLVWSVEDIENSWAYTATPTHKISFQPSESIIHHNASMFAHVFLSLRTAATIDEADKERFDPHSVLHKVFPLVKYKQKKREVALRKLLDDDVQVGVDAEAAATTEDVSSSTPLAYVAYWKPTLHLNLVMDMASFGRNLIPPPVAKHLQFTELGDFFPLLHHNEFWQLSKNLAAINETTTELPLSLSFSLVSFFYWHIQTSLEEQWHTQQKSGMGTERETDIIREMLLDTNPWLLAVTGLVSLLHTVFDILAFKNDIQFWSAKRNMQGMSVRSLVVNCFFQTVIILYLFDNDTSTMILFSSGIGVLIEYWKLTKAFKIAVEWPTSMPKIAGAERKPPTPPNFAKRLIQLLGLPSLSFTLSDSYSGHSTERHDETATTHLLYLIIPLVTGYSIYSLLHNPHKSFYSWALGSLVGFVYAFGFVLMTPQLYINYKLKSVAHMPWKAMVYKALNTFIDDLFAFIIKMPTMHRLACFRDDFIFFIYLYQKWTYKVDYTRTNEFGQGGEDTQEQEEVATITEGKKRDSEVVQGESSNSAGAATAVATTVATTREATENLTSTAIGATAVFEAAAAQVE